MENQVTEKIINILKNTHNIEAKMHYEINAIWKQLVGEIEIELNENIIRFPVVIKKEIKKQNLLDIYIYKDIFTNILILADFINTGVRKQLKDKLINYIDGAGNMYLKTNENYIYVEGNPNEKVKRNYKGRLFGKGGIKTIFVLLLNEKLINAPYRDIAEFADTALGTVNNTINELILNGYVFKINTNELKFKNKKELLNKWITGYEEKLKHTLLKGKFKLNNYQWKNIKFNNETLWGGEPAAEILTQYLLPQLFTIYTKEDTKDLTKNYNLIPDVTGNIDIYKKFWNYEVDENNKNTVPPLLIYADLINTGDNRNLETAEIIYERYLQDKFK